jgi:glyoxylase-like metal-dependent hydrolase (beta-lactamase superfamily II)
VREKPIIHRLQGSAFPVNAYLVEAPNGVVLVDSTLTRSDGRAIRARIDDLGKPLLGALVTHAHPDHYGALVEIVRDETVPIVATAGVDHVIRHDDPPRSRSSVPCSATNGRASASSRIEPYRTVNR